MRSSDCRPRLLVCLILLGALRGRALEPGTLIAIPEGSFEEQGKHWRIPADGLGRIVEDEEADGRFCLRIEDTTKEGGSDVTSARFPLPAGGLYVLRGWVRPERGSGLGLYVRRFNREGKLISGESHVIGLGGDSGVWAPFEQEFIVSEHAHEGEVWIHSYQAAMVTACIDNLELEFRMGPDSVTETDMDTVKRRLTARVRGGIPTTDTVANLLQQQQRDGRWPDIDYEDGNRASWKPAGHMARILMLARAYAGGDQEMPAELRIQAGEALGRGLDFWFEKDFTCPNWWYNQIGIPRQLYRIMLLTEDLLTAAQREAGLRILERARLGMTGQNLVWVAEVTIARGFLAHQPMVVWEAFRRIEREIKVTTGEGIQPDWSFHQHGAQLYSGGYGRGFSQDCPHFASLAQGTHFAFADEKIEILGRYLLDGQQWMTRWQRFDYSACGREIVRRRAANARGLAAACRHMLTVHPERADEYRAFAERLERGTVADMTAPAGNRHFWRSDFTVHHRPEWYASVRVTSPRLVQTENGNGENLIGALLSDGVTYLLTDGDDYDGIFPVWDWKRLPGITVVLDGTPPTTRGGVRGMHAFAGGVSDGHYGCTAMVFQRGALRAKKAWFFHDRYMVCLGTAIGCDTDAEVITSVNQCLLQGPVTVATRAGVTPLHPGEHELEAVDWIHHASFGYVPLETARFRARNDTQTGNWHRINRRYPQTEVALDVFSLSWIHGRQPDRATYAYAVVNEPRPDMLGTLTRNLAVEVLSNTASLQALRHGANGMLQAVFHEHGALEGPGGGFRVSVDQPCLLLLTPTDTGMRLSLCDPTGEADSVALTISGRYRLAEMDRQAVVSTADSDTTVRVALPTQRERAGSTVTCDLQALQ